MLYSYLSPENCAHSTPWKEEIHQSPKEYYWSDNWTPEWYVILAQVGMISVATESDHGPILLPEMQSAYAVLDWENLRVSRSMRRWMRKESFAEQEFALHTEGNLSEIIQCIAATHGHQNWLGSQYSELLHALYEEDGSNMENFRLLPVALKNKHGELVAGEIGYVIGQVYTSLTGFFIRGRAEWNHAGKLQLLHLAHYLKDQELEFWNLGHPHMQYKLDLGAKVLSRSDFLQRWIPATRSTPTREVS